MNYKVRMKAENEEEYKEVILINFQNASYLTRSGKFILNGHLYIVHPDDREAFEAQLLQSPPPSEPPPEEPEYHIIVVVAEDKVPLREITGSNRSGYPIFGIYGKSDVSKRVIAKKGKNLKAYPGLVRGDGGKNAYRLLRSQIVDGKDLAEYPHLYILERHVE